MLKYWQVIFIVFIFHVPMGLHAESTIKVFQTQQTAQTLIPTIEPLYRNQAKFTAKNNSLIVKAPESIIQEIEQLLKQLDKPLQNLLIEVISSLDGNDNFQQDSIEGKIKTGDVDIRSRAPDNNDPNVSIQYKKDGTVIKSNHTRRRSSKNSPDTFKIRTVEGHWAYIQVGQKVPYYSSDAPYPYNNKHRYPGTWRQSVQLEDVTSGFDVYPTLNGNKVTLKVRPHNSSMNLEYPDRINTRSVDTVVTGELGQWIYLGGAINQLNEKTSGTIYSTRRSSDLDSNYRIKVNTID